MLRFAKFVGANTDFSTAQAFLFPRVPLEDTSEPVFGLVIKGEGEDIFVYIRQKILSLEEQFFSPYERITEKLHSLGELISTQFSMVEKLQFTLFCVHESTFYVYQFGDNPVLLLRDGKVSPVLGDKSLQEKVISGFIKKGDRIIVLSQRNEGEWSEEVVSQVINLKGDEVEDAEPIFAKESIKNPDEGDFAGVRGIESVAFILIENAEVREIKNLDEVKLPAPRVNFKVDLPKFNLWIFLHRISRRLFGVFRVINKKVLVGIFVIILIGAIGAGGYYFWKNNNFAKNKRLENLIISVEASLNEAGALKDSDSKQAGEKIAQAKSRLSEAEGLAREDSRIENLKTKIAEKEAEVLRIYSNLNFELFMSLDLIKEDFKTNRMSFSVGKILLLDKQAKSLVAVDTSLKTPSILAGPLQLGNASIASLNGSHAFVYASDKGITHVDIDTKKVSSVTTPDQEWGFVKDIFGFSSNVYVLDTGKNMIWKYAPTESGYSGRLEYLRSEANLGLGSKLVIDYSVWVLTSEPNILKFTAGASDYYAPSNLSENLMQIDNLFVPEELDNVFILDKSKNRILVTKKNGEYFAQYVNEQFAKADDFFVDEEGELIYLLIENKIYTTPLR